MSGRHARTGRAVATRPRSLAWRGYAPLDASMAIRMTAAVGDVAEGLRRWRSWSYLAVESVKNQYRRTVVGPWWLTMQTAAYTVGLGVLFGAIFHQPLDKFLPYVAAGFIGFSLLAGLTRSGADVFVIHSATLLSTRQPLSLLVFQIVSVELLQFAHNTLILAFFLVLGLLPVTPVLLLVVPAVLIIVLNGVAVGLWLGPTVARFRDVGPFVASIMQVMMFFTPVFWQVDEIDQDSRGALLAWNPFAYLLGLFREPLLGEVPSFAIWLGVSVVTGLNILLAAWVFTRTRSRLPYWVS